MKHLKLSQSGFSHIVLPLLAVFLIVVIGIYVITANHTKTCKGTVLNQSSNGQCVFYAQQLANAAFPASTPVTMDGQYSSQTTALVKQFQSKLGLTTSGIVDGKTWSDLCSSTKTSPNLYGSWAAAKLAGC